MQTTTTPRCAHADSVAGEGQIETHYLFIATFQLSLCVLCALCMCMYMHVFMHAGIYVYH